MVEEKMRLASKRARLTKAGSIRVVRRAASLPIAEDQAVELEAVENRWRKGSNRKTRVRACCQAKAVTEWQENSSGSVGGGSEASRRGSSATFEATRATS